MNWLNHPAINKTEIARRMGWRLSILNNKLTGYQNRHFTPADISRLTKIKAEIIKELIL
ncbi:hypothetical protein GCM10028807_32840 [Spirosoma daeguense]